jgi:thiamine transport system substrate-binding protein
MRIGLVLTILLISLPPGFAPSSALAAQPLLTLVAYDSFLAKGGLGPAIFPLFESRCHCKLRTISVGSAGQLVGRLELAAKRHKPLAQVVIGLDAQSFFNAVAKKFVEPWGGWQPRDFYQLSGDARIGNDFLPIDYGILAFIADKKQMKERKLVLPRHMSDLADPKWKRNFILEDPRTSAPGLDFMLFAQTQNQEDAIRGQWLTLAPGWDSAYGLFLKGEAPMVWSYVTSQAYQEMHGDSEGRYVAVVFDDEMPFQVEGAILVRDSFRSPEERKLATDFLEFLVSPEVQKLIPEKNWMFPARDGTPLPAAYSHLPRPRRLLRLPDDPVQVDSRLKSWERAAGQKR